MTVELATPWPSLRDDIRRAQDQLDRELAFLRTELFDTRLERTAQTLAFFESRASQTVAKIDRQVAALKSEVEERLAGLDARVPVLHERVAWLEDAKHHLEERAAARPVTAYAVASISAAIFSALTLVSYEALALSIPRSAILAAVVVAIGAGVAHGCHSLGWSVRTGRTLGLIVAIILGGGAGLIIEAGAGEAPQWRRLVLVAVAAAAGGVVFGAVHGYIVTTEERRRRRLYNDAINGMSATENELRRVIPYEQQQLRAADVALAEMASNNCRIAREHFVNRASRLLEAAPAARRSHLEVEFSTLRAQLDQKIRVHLETSGEPDSWSGPSN